MKSIRRVLLSFLKGIAVEDLQGILISNRDMVQENVLSRLKPVIYEKLMEVTEEDTGLEGEDFLRYVGLPLSESILKDLLNNRILKFNECKTKDGRCYYSARLGIFSPEDVSIIKEGDKVESTKDTSKRCMY